MSHSHAGVALPCRSPARRSEVGGGGSRAGLCQGGFSQPTLTIPPHSCCIPLVDKGHAAQRSAARLQLGLKQGLGMLESVSQSHAGDQPRGHGQHTHTHSSDSFSKKHRHIELLKGPRCRASKCTYTHT